MCDTPMVYYMYHICDTYLKRWYKDMKVYVVYDRCSDNWSNYYENYDDAKNDFDNDISYQWSMDAVIEEIEVK